MYIESLTIRNFKCFGNNPETIRFDPGITGFVGSNGSGKTATLEALKKLFSPVASERRLQLSDVHFGPNEDSQNVADKEITIDVVIGFSDMKQIPHVFNDIFFSATDGELKARLLLEGNYSKSESDTDDIDVKLYTVRTVDEVQFGPDDERKSPLQGRPTRFAEIVYIPAHRDSMGVTQIALKQLLRRLERSADWEDATKDKSQELAKELEKELNSTPAVETITEDLKIFWKQLHDGHYDADPSLSVVAKDFDQLIRELTLRFDKSPGGGQRKLNELSEGQISLLYFTITATLQKLIWKMDLNTGSSSPSLSGFKSLDFVPAPLIIFALEEPENHLSPFYLPRLINLLKELLKMGNTQSFITSHSSSVLSRINLQNVRFFRCNTNNMITNVKQIPHDFFNERVYKFINQVALSNPEIYFARLVVIGEGDSERVVIPKIAEAFGVHLDPSFIAYVSIGGRHAKFIWQLSKLLDIPKLTLLDFDMGRYQGGMGRISNVIKWLEEIKDEEKITLEKNIPDNTTDKATIERWIMKLRSIGIFYSYILDLDMMMIKSFPEAYKLAEESETSIDETKLQYAVFGKSGLNSVDKGHIDQEISTKDLYIYDKLFNKRSKPVSHHIALIDLKDEDIRQYCPEPLKALIKEACKKLEISCPEELENLK